MTIMCDMFVFIWLRAKAWKNIINNFCYDNDDTHDDEDTYNLLVG